ncbi:Hypothetical predicted protein [Podarcis lilfordi]|uniref:Uncharacterized protein n=1 Tax=Podarcis lilfordi TaxID=74358 RepID=A0AA35KAU4_9SAUR|nr:Hypothetical predicted protein [Podarcis lilfordi]
MGMRQGPRPGGLTCELPVSLPYGGLFCFGPLQPPPLGEPRVDSRVAGSRCLGFPPPQPRRGGSVLPTSDVLLATQTRKEPCPERARGGGGRREREAATSGAEQGRLAGWDAGEGHGRQPLRRDSRGIRRLPSEGKAVYLVLSIILATEKAVWRRNRLFSIEKLSA